MLHPPAGGCARGSPPLTGMESPRRESGLKVSLLNETYPTASLDPASCFAAAVSFDPVNSYPWLLSGSSLFFSRYTSHCWLHSFSATLVSYEESSVLEAYCVSSMSSNVPVPARSYDL
jgi:hypothetical protein